MIEEFLYGTKIIKKPSIKKMIEGFKKIKIFIFLPTWIVFTFQTSISIQFDLWYWPQEFEI